MKEVIAILGFVLTSLTASAQRSSYPDVRIGRVEGKATLDYFRAIESGFKRNSQAFLECYTTYIGNPNEFYRYKKFSIDLSTRPNGTFSFEKDIASKESNESWARMPQKYRQADDCMKGAIGGLQIINPAGSDDTTIDLTVEINF